MPPKKQYRRTTKKAPAKYRKRKYTRQNTRIRSLVVPNACYTKFRFVDDAKTSFRISSGSALNYQVWNINGLYDASPAIGNSAVAGFAEWMKFYNKYRVMGVKYRLTIVGRDAEPTRLLTHTTTDDIDYSSYTWSDWMQVRGNPRCRQVTLGGAAGGHETRILKGFVSLPRLCGNPTTYKTDIAYEGTSTANPTRNLQLHLMQGTYDGTVKGSNGEYSLLDAQFTYYVKLYDRKVLVAG